MSGYAGYWWCWRCERFAPFTHPDCTPTARAKAVELVREGLKHAGPLLGRTVKNTIEKALDWVEDHARRGQGIREDVNHAWWADAGDREVGPFFTTGEAIQAYIDHFSAQTRKSLNVFDPSGGVGRSTRPARSTEPPRPARESAGAIGVLVAELPPGITIHRRDLLFFIVQDGRAITFPLESVALIQRGLTQALDGGSPSAWGSGDASSSGEDAPPVPE